MHISFLPMMSSCFLAVLSWLNLFEWARKGLSGLIVDIRYASEYIPVVVTGDEL